MRSATRLISRLDDGGATVWPVTLAQVKANAQIEHTAEDDLIHDGDDGILPAAVEHVEEMSQVALVTQTRVMTIDDEFPDKFIEVAFPPLQSITSIEYVDSDYATQTFDSSNYRAATNGFPGRVALKSGSSWPSPVEDAEVAIVTFVCGFGDTASDVPMKWKQPILVLATYWWNHRDAYAKRNMDLAFKRSLQAMIDTAGRRATYK